MNALTAQTRISLTSLLMAASLLLFAAASHAAGDNRPCADDAAKFCKGMERGGGRIAACLREHSNELSPACKENLGKAKEHAREAKEACLDDKEKHCKNVQPGQGRIAQCLKQHESELSAECKEHLAKPQGQRN